MSIARPRVPSVLPVLLLAVVCAVALAAPAGAAPAGRATAGVTAATTDTRVASPSALPPGGVGIRGNAASVSAGGSQRPVGSVVTGLALVLGLAGVAFLARGGGPGFTARLWHRYPA